MVGEFESSSSSQSMTLSEQDKLTPEERFKQRLVEHLKGAELEFPRFQAFADYTDLQNTRRVLGKSAGYNEDMIQETIRQRENGVKGYIREFQQINRLGLAYFTESGFSSSFSRSEHKYKYARLLAGIKNEEIDKRNQKPQTPLEQ